MYYLKDLKIENTKDGYNIEINYYTSINKNILRTMSLNKNLLNMIFSTQRKHTIFNFISTFINKLLFFVKTLEKSDLVTYKEKIVIKDFMRVGYVRIYEDNEEVYYGEENKCPVEYK